METVVCIPTRRPPPVLTLENYRPQKHRVMLICDPRVYHEHSAVYINQPNISIHLGSIGMGAQSALCYKMAHDFGFKTFLRLDDDLPDHSFVHKDGHYPGVEELIRECQNCMSALDVTLVGFVNSSNPYYLGLGYRLTYGIIWGGANLAVSSDEPEDFIDPKLLRCEDIYRTCAHRKWDVEAGGEGRNGRVQHIGVDKSKSSGKGRKGNISTIQISREQIEAQRQIVRDRFPEFISRLDDEMVRFRR